MDEDKRLRRLRTVQSLNTVAYIAGPVSILFGGVLLSTIALICAIVSFTMIRSVSSAYPQDDLVNALRRQSVVAIIITAATFVINGVFFAMTFTMLMDAMQSGDYSQIFDFFADGESAAGESVSGGHGSSKSVWD